MSELATDLNAPLASVQNELTRLIDGAVLASRKVGRARLVRANTASPAVAPLTQLTLVTFGPQTVVGEEFAPLNAERIVVFGSWAARYHGVPGPPPADLDVLVIGEGIDRTQMYAAAERVEARIGLPVNPVLRPSGAWTNTEGDSLLIDIQAGAYVDVTARP